MFDVSLITVHPRLVEAYSAFGVLRAALEKNLARVAAIDLRNFAVDRHGSVDAPPYGGGDGMVLRPEPLADAVQSLSIRPKVLLTSPSGKRWTQREAERWVTDLAPLAIVCGRFAGVDQRFIDAYVDEEYSAGDFVLAGGELPALMMVESMLRLLPGVLGNDKSAQLDSFSPAFAGGLEHPLYTRPEEFQGKSVPEVLLSGDHARIEAWRQREREARTRRLRPDLLSGK